jgi:hypothetical protein
LVPSIRRRHYHLKDWREYVHLPPPVAIFGGDGGDSEFTLSPHQWRENFAAAVFPYHF